MRKRTFHIRAIWHRSATAFGGALACATGLASYPSGYHLFTWQRCIFCIATDPDSFHDCCLEFVAIPTGTPALSLLSEDFAWLTVAGQFSIPAVLMLQ